MLTVVNQFKVSFLSIKYAIMREMTNKTSFILNIVFMILNNACFLIQWKILYSINKNIGGFTFNQVILLWGMACLTFGISRFLFKKSFKLSDEINSGKLDTLLVAPKNILISFITQDVDISCIGDIIYAYIMLAIYGITLKNILLYTLFGILGALIITSLAIILGSLSFWLDKSDMIADSINNLMISFSTYPSDIFKKTVKVILYTIVPIGLSNYIPVNLIIKFNIKLFLVVILSTIFFVSFSFIIFYKGLKRYSSSNLMSARI